MHPGPRSQRWSAEGYAANAGFVPALGEPLVDLLDPRPGQRVLDLGCGDGALTARIAERGARVLGVDSSPDLLDAARARGLEVARQDGRRLAFDAAFDAVFSNAALHWMDDQDAVLEGVFRALKSGGRLVAEMGGHGNVAAIVTALMAALRWRGIDGAARMPWHFPAVEACSERLRRHGFEVERIESFARPTPLPTGMRGWLETFANPFLEGLEAAVRESVLEDAVALLEPSLRGEGGVWTADYVRLRFVARKPGRDQAA
ncbi:MAG TPA: methyltransferase domain-containing protein [Gammaproteobacteria bacterium]|nr:methyltransferase domain-containing protein [Gammaproteobacteria bacterium]